ncbi:hypothetical protein [uncultured Enterococcus sp.]|uniref:hypothetical protein n=1 Tax=uncultured Enterococcus sp. TaxID=167972 RepID=UPI002AA8A0B1|nr:hypothetical protein [uncultured Enterococcus sp.]
MRGKAFGMGVNDIFVLFIREVESNWRGFFCGWRMYLGDYYPVHVDYVEEMTGFKSNNRVKIYTSYRRALNAAHSVIRRSTFAVQIVSLEQAQEAQLRTISLFVDWDGMKRRIHRLYDNEGKKLPYQNECV